jgi:uncharacterized delta-60 repeat protein
LNSPIYFIFQRVVLAGALFALSACGMYGFKPKAEAFGGVVGADIVSMRVTPDLTEMAPGDCVGIKIEFLSADGKVLYLRDPSSISLSGLRPTDSVYSDNQCKTLVTPDSLKMATGETGKSLYFRSSASGSISLETTLAGLVKKATPLTMRALPRVLAIQTAGPNMTLPAGFCSGPYSVQLQDNFGAPVIATRYEVLVNDNANGIDDAVFVDNACMARPTGSKLQIANDNKAVFYLRGKTVSVAAKDLIVSSADARATGDTRSIFFEAVPYRLQITGGPSGPSILGKCENTGFNLDLLDVDDRPVFPKTGSTVNANLNFALMGVFQNNCSSTPATFTQLTFTSTERSKSFNIVPRARNQVNFQITAENLQSASRSVSVSAVPLSVTFIGPSPLTAGSVSSLYTVTLKDGLLADIAAPSDLAINIGGTLPAISTVCTNPADCVASVSKITIPAGSTFGTFAVRPNPNLEARTENLSVTPEDTSITGAQLSVQINRRQPAKFRLSGGPSPARLGVCEPTAFTLEILDAQNQPVTVPTGFSYIAQLGFSNGSGDYFNSCGEAATTRISFSARESSKNIYLRATARTSVTMEAVEMNNALTPAALSVSVIAVPIRVSVTGPADIIAGNISAPPVTATLLDGLNAPIAATNSVIMPISGSITSVSKLCSDAACNNEISQVAVPSGSTNVSFYIQPKSDLEDRTENVTVTPPEATSIASGTLSISILRRLPAKIRITDGPSNNRVNLNECSTPGFNAELLDANDVAVTVPTGSSYALDLTVNPGLGAYYAGSVCGGSVVTQLVFSAGQQSRPFSFKALFRGSVTLVLSEARLTSATEVLTVITEPKALDFVLPTSVVAGVPSSAMRVNLVDALVAPIVAPSAVVVTLGDNTPAARAMFCAVSTCPANGAITQLTIPAGQSGVNFYYLSDADADITQSISASTSSLAVTGATGTLSVDRRALDVNVNFSPANAGHVMGTTQFGAKAIAAGYLTVSGVKRFMVSSYNWDVNNPAAMGSLDTSFSGNGKLDFQLGDESWAAAVAPQGNRIIVAGVTKNSSGGDTDIALFRVLANGTVDPAFRASGYSVAIPGNQYATSVAVASDGYIYVAGYGAPDAPTADNASDFVLLAFDSNGSLAGSFKYDVSGLTEVATSVAIQTVSGMERVVLAGAQSTGSPTSGETNSTSEFLFIRVDGRANLSSQGTMDTSFGTLGRAVVEVGGAFGAIVRGLTILPGNQIIGAGYRVTSAGGSSHMVLASLGVDGTLATILPSGVRVLDLSSTQEKAFAIDNNPRTGEIYLTGSSELGYTTVRYVPSTNAFNAKFLGSNGDVAKGIFLDSTNFKPVAFGTSGSTGNINGIRYLR